MSKKEKKVQSKKVEETKKVTGKRKKSSISITLLLIPILLGLLLAFPCYHIFQCLTTIPDTPQLDLDYWWGPNETKSKQNKDIRPYRIVFGDGMLHDLRMRFDSYRTETKKVKSLKDAAWTYGINSEAFSQFFSNWIFQYKPEERVKFLNQFDQFKTNIQGLDIHFIHVKPKVKKGVKVLPLLLLHGWPSSVREFYEAIPLLTTVRPGYDFVFEVIAPNLPGFVYSQGPVRPGLSPTKISIVIRNLMQRLGFKKYYIQGGDFGHSVGSGIATLFPNEVLGIHTNFPANFANKAYLAWILGAIWPTLVEKEYTDRLYPLAKKVEFFLEEFGYLHLQATKPDTIGIALQDSPPGLAAYILDRFMIFTDVNNKYTEDGGLSKHYNHTKLLDNIMLYWASGCITTSVRLYKESVGNSEFEQVIAKIPTPVPTWALRLKHEIVFHPEFILKWKYPNFVGATTLDYGGHFAALELPEEFADDIFKAVKSFIGFTNKEKEF
ncbi:juvenile hormone epoxide hydrolase-like [Galleria mellonella]|uniref:microsomal epoxide hydrolase n=1 Tax=Galleria mellonella TaxID=7137 RepID=A0A6J1X524_GALME|nr:juvenile hormone epoxide hydrolase-like [Galleria mellonella]